MSLLNINASALNKFRKILQQSNSKAIHLSLRSGGYNGFDSSPATKKLCKNKELHSENELDIHISKFNIGTEIRWSTDIMRNTNNNQHISDISPKPSELKRDKVIERMRQRDRW